MEPQLSNSLHVFNESCQVAWLVKGLVYCACKLHTEVFVKQVGGCWPYAKQLNSALVL